MTEVVISGCCGKMGRVVNEIISNRNDAHVCEGIDINAVKYSDFTVVSCPNQLTSKPDVIIDFSHRPRWVDFWTMQRQTAQL